MSHTLALSPLKSLLALINAQTSVVLTEDDIHTLFPPQVIPDAAAGMPNTGIALRTGMDFSHAGRVSLQYRRLDLADLTPYALTATVEDNATLEQYLGMLCLRYGLTLSAHDIESVDPFDVSGGALSYAVSLRAKPDSLMYVGTGTFNVNVNWRLDDPELVELQIDRLRTLLNVTMPLTFSNFMHP